MSDSRNDLPGPNAPNFEQRVREALMTYMGRTGNPMDRGLTLRDLMDNGLVTLPAGYTLRSGGQLPPLVPGTSIGNPEIDLTPPPQPSGFQVASAISHVFIEHDAPLYTQGGGHLRTHVYGVTISPGDPAPVFDDAVELTQFSGTVHAHPSNPSTTWRLWIKWETQAGVLSPTPAGGANGLLVTTGDDVSLLLQALNGEITESQLYADLGTRINLIDGTGAGSVAARIAVESAARVAALTLEATNRTNAIQNEAGIRAADLITEALARANGDSTLQSQINLLSAASSGDLGELIAVVEAEQTARIAGDAAEALSRETLATQMRGAYTGTDLAQITTGLIHSERTARSTADGAIASDVSALSTTVTNNYNTLNSAITDEATTRATADTAEANSRNTLTTKLIGAANPATATLASLTTGLLYDERTSRSTADSTEVTARQLLSSTMIGAVDATGKTLANVTSGIIFDEKTARTTADTAQVGRLSTLEATVNNASTGVVATSTALDAVELAVNNATTGVVASATRLTNLETTVNTGPDRNTALRSTITSEATTRASADTALATRATNLESSASAANDVLYIKDTRTTNEPPSYYYTNYPLRSIREFKTSTVIGAVTGATYGDLTTTTRWTDPSGGPVTQVFSTGDSLNVVSRFSTSTSAWSAWKNDVVDLTAVVGTKASVTQVATAKAEAIAASATVTDTISARLNSGDFAAVQVQSSANASSVTGLLAQYTVKLDVGGKVSGYVLASSSTSSEFAIRADRFYIAPPADSAVTTDIIPFAVEPAATTINGVPVPAGVYINDAFIKNGTITNAKIANLSVDSAKISSLDVGKLTAGSIAVGQHIQSTNYFPGSAGWIINGSGNAEFSNVTVRGSVVGSTITGGTITGSVITGATIQTATSGQRILMDASGLLFLAGVTTGKYGTFKYGNAKKYGSGVLVYFNNATKRVPFYVAAEQNVADIHLYNRGANPVGATYEAGDMICVGGRLKIYVPALGGWKTLALEP